MRMNPYLGLWSLLGAIVALSVFGLLGGFRSASEKAADTMCGAYNCLSHSERLVLIRTRQATPR
jgi:hypothetical protein